MAIMDPNRTIDNNTSNTTTPQCGPGEKLINGVCVAIGMQSGLGLDTSSRPNYNPFPNRPQQNQSAGGIAGLYGDILQGYQQATDVNIQGARTTAALEQERLNKQLEQQRQDYLKNRQTLQKETFLRGRNVLANLANRGLATSGLQQLGDVQRTIATGQQMNELSQAFERAREGLSLQQTQVATGLQQFEAQQRAALGQQAAALGLQEYRDVIQDKERSVAYAESLATLLNDPEIAQEVKDALTPLYEALISTPGVSDTGVSDTGGTGGTGSLAEALNVDIPTQKTTTQLSTNILNNIGGEGNIFGTEDISALEKSAFRDYVNKNENLQQNSELRTAIAQSNGNYEINLSNTKTFGAGLNDDYEVLINGKDGYIIKGKELAVLIMSGEVEVSPEIAVSILQMYDGNLIGQVEAIGNEDDAFVSLMRSYLQKQGYIKQETPTSFKLIVDTSKVTNPLRG